MLGSIAQLVQSVCLTSRGSGVRLPLLPRKKRPEFPVASFVMMKVETPGPLLGGISRASENGVSEGNARAEMPETGRKTVSACPWGLSRSDWGIDGRALACQGLGFDSLCSHKRSDRNYPVALFVMMKVETPDS